MSTPYSRLRQKIQMLELLRKRKSAFSGFDGRLGHILNINIRGFAAADVGVSRKVSIKSDRKVEHRRNLSMNSDHARVSCFKRYRSRFDCIRRLGDGLSK